MEYFGTSNLQSLNCPSQYCHHPKDTGPSTSIYREIISFSYSKSVPSIAYIPIISQIVVARLQIPEGYVGSLCDSKMASGARNAGGVLLYCPRRASVAEGKNASLRSGRAENNSDLSAYSPKKSRSMPWLAHSGVLAHLFLCD